MSGCDRELNAHFYSAASLKYHVPDTSHDTTPSHIILTQGRPVLALPRKLSARRGAAGTIFYDFGMWRPRIEPVTSCSPEWTLYQLSYRGRYFGIMSQYDTTFDLKINVGHCDLYFMGQWFCLMSWRLYDIWKPYFGIMSQYDPMCDLKINYCYCDLYFMVQWFCLISWKLFGSWTSYFGTMSQYDHTSNLKIFNDSNIELKLYMGPRLTKGTLQHSAI